MENLPIIEVVVCESGKCPVLRRGDRFVYRHPAVEAEGMCGQALSVIAPAAEDMARRAAEGPVAPFTMTCPSDDCGAYFELVVLPPNVPVMHVKPRGLAARSGRKSRRDKEGDAEAKKGTRSPMKRGALVLVALLVVGGLALGGISYFAPQLVPRQLVRALADRGISIPWLRTVAPAAEEREGGSAAERDATASETAGEDAGTTKAATEAVRPPVAAADAPAEPTQSAEVAGGPRADATAARVEPAAGAVPPAAGVVDAEEPAEADPPAAETPAVAEQTENANAAKTNDAPVETPADAERAEKEHAVPIGDVSSE